MKPIDHTTRYGRMNPITVPSHPRMVKAIMSSDKFGYEFNFFYKNRENFYPMKNDF